MCRGDISARGGADQHCGIKRSDFFAFIWPDGGINENRSALRSVGRWLSAVGRLPAIKLLARWRAFLSCSHTYRSNSDKWDVTALVKQGYNLSKYNIICDLTWQPHCLLLTSQLAWVHLQNLTGFLFIYFFFISLSHSFKASLNALIVWIVEDTDFCYGL